MTRVFSALLSGSAAVGVLILAVILARALLRRAPRSLLCLLWVPVVLRLLLPLPLRSPLSLIPAAASRESVSAWTETRLRTIPIPGELPENEELLTDPAPEAAQAAPEPASPAPVQAASEASPRAPADGMTIAARIWAGGVLAMLLWAALSTLRLRRQVRTSARVERDVRVCDCLRSPFILGLIRPRIYLPSDLDPADGEMIVAHERTHLRRRDHIWKPLGFLLLSLWWFHPLVWAAFILFCRDVELACDEAVVRALDSGGRRAYAETLLRCSMPRRGVAACPLAFGETGVKSRIRAVLNYRKPAFWLILAAAAALIVLAVCFLTEPKGKDMTAEPDAAAAEQSDEAEDLSDTAEPPSGSAASPEMEQTAEISGPADAERVKVFGAALEKLAEDFDGTGQEPDFENLNAFLKSRADFNTLTANLDDVAALLRQGFTVGSTRERMLVHYVMAREIAEENPGTDFCTGLDSITPMEDADYDDMLGAVASHPEPYFSQLTGELPDMAPYAYRNDPDYSETLNVLFKLYPGFPYEGDEVIYQSDNQTHWQKVYHGKRADGQEAELTLTTELAEIENDGVTVGFLLSDQSRLWGGTWRYSIRGNVVKLVSASEQGDYSAVLRALWETSVQSLPIDHAAMQTVAGVYADLPFDASPIALFGAARKTAAETLDMTDESWQYLTLENGQTGLRPTRIAPETVDGLDWTLYCRFSIEQDVESYLYDVCYERPLSANAAERKAEVERVYRLLCGALGDPDLPYMKASVMPHSTTIGDGLANGFSASPCTASWVLAEGVDIPGWADTAVLCVYTVETTPAGTSHRVEYTLRSTALSRLARYEQDSGIERSGISWGSMGGTVVGEEVTEYPDFSAPFRDHFGMGMHDFAAASGPMPGWNAMQSSYERYPFEKKAAQTVDGVRYDVRFWGDTLYEEPLLNHADYTPTDPVTTADMKALAAELTEQYGQPLAPRYSVRPLDVGTKPLGTALDSGADLADGVYKSVWLVSDTPDYPAHEADFFPAEFRSWSYYVEAATLTALVRDGNLTYTLAFDVKPLRALPVDYTSMDPR